MESDSHISLKRIYKDLEEFRNFPLKGIGICIPDLSNPFELRSNILLLDGIYKNIMLHLIMNFPENYPVKGPQILLAPNQYFTNAHHSYIFQDKGSGGYLICVDLLDYNFFGNYMEGGWSPDYTISAILLQLQVFLCDLMHRIR